MDPIGDGPLDRIACIAAAIGVLAFGAAVVFGVILALVKGLASQPRRFHQ